MRLPAICTAEASAATRSQRKISLGMTSSTPTSLPETSSERNSLRTIDLHGPAGRLEALLNEGAPDAQFVGLVCHPHPLGGGNMHNKVVYHAMKVLNAAEWNLRWPVLRFNFRGTGTSEGQHDGRAESADVLAAIHWLHAEYKLPIILVGFSFGAAMAIAASCAPFAPTDGPNLRALALLGLPTHGFKRSYEYPLLSTCTLPKLFVSGDQDQYATKVQLGHAFDSAADPRTLVLVPEADHFFTGHLDQMQKALAGWLKEQTR
jgi:alpha/beta superfamily hydrolase